MYDVFVCGYLDIIGFYVEVKYILCLFLFSKINWMNFVLSIKISYINGIINL